LIYDQDIIYQSSHYYIIMVTQIMVAGYQARG
jgi:hypothetical protein